MPEPRAQRRLTTILSADAVGFSRLMAADEMDTVQLLAASRRVMGAAIERFGGRVVDAPGDNLLAEFPSVVDAVECAVEIQRELGELDAERPADRRMPFRIGVNLGDVVVDEGRIYGDGVNVAARLEGLADPGGVCVSGTAYDQVRNKLPYGYADLGERAVKNIPEPVRVYRLRPERRDGATEPVPPARAPRRRLALAIGVLLVAAFGLWASWPRPVGVLIDLAGVSAPPVNPPLPEEPSIVVLPFTNMSNDPDQEYLADGITEDLTTDLSRNQALFVISRNSAFTYKGEAVKIEDVGRELGVRYVVEGSVRRESDRVRVTAQLIDATSGFHLWGERYDRQLADLFAVQAELSEQIMGAVGVEIRAAEMERTRRKPTESQGAHDVYMRAFHHYMKFTREDHARARELIDRALELDPEYANAHALLAGIHLNEYFNLWSLDPSLPERVVAQADRALAIDPANSIGLVDKAAGLAAQGRVEEARVHAERAVEVDPNWDVPHTFLAYIQVLSGDPLGALQSTRKALRRNPKISGGDLLAIADINLLAGRTEVAREIYERIRADNPDMIVARLQLAVLYEGQGRADQARTLVEESLRVNPDLTAEAVVSARSPALADAEERAALRESLRRAGLP